MTVAVNVADGDAVVVGRIQGVNCPARRVRGEALVLEAAVSLEQERERVARLRIAFEAGVSKQHVILAIGVELQLEEAAGTVKGNGVADQREISDELPLAVIIVKADPVDIRSDGRRR